MATAVLFRYTGPLFGSVMATSDLSAALSSLEAYRDESPDGRNVAEILEATIEEATHSDGNTEEPKEYLHGRGPGNLPIEL